MGAHPLRRQSRARLAVAVVGLLRKRLSCEPSAPYSFAASEALRVCGFKMDRAQVRRWAM